MEILYNSLTDIFRDILTMNQYVRFLKRYGDTVVENEVLLLENDELRKILFIEPEYTRAENSKVYEIAGIMVNEFKKFGVPVIHDATNLFFEHNEVKQEEGYIWIHVFASEEETIRRAESKSQDRKFSEAGLEVYHRMRYKPDEHFVSTKCDYFFDESNIDDDEFLTNIALNHCQKPFFIISGLPFSGKSKIAYKLFDLLNN